MNQGTAKPTELDVLKGAMQGALARVHTAQPGVVVSYNAEKQTATVRLALKSKYRDATTKEVKSYDVPQLSNVPVAFPGSGDWSVVWPLEAGDEVLVVFSERSLDEWKSSGGGGGHEVSDARRFDVTDAIAIPGLRSPARAVPAEGLADNALVVRGAEIRLGSSAASDYVALASLVLAELDALRAELQAHTHPVPGVTAGPATVSSSTPIGIGASSGPVAASKVKAE